jgi:uncharacterized Zn finger protein (UPF0148 family)
VLLYQKPIGFSEEKMSQELLNCPGCGSTDMERKDGFFVCGHCGSKIRDKQYSKLEINTKVEHSHYADHSKELENSLQNARRAVKSEAWDDVRRYYTQVREYDSDSLEAYLFKPLADLILSQKSEDYNNRADIINVLCKNIRYISELWKDSEHDLATLDIFIGKLDILLKMKFTQKSAGKDRIYEKMPLYQDFAVIIMSLIKELVEITESGCSESLDRFTLRECNLLFLIRNAKFNTKVYNKIIEEAHKRIAAREPGYIIPKKIKRYSRRQVGIFGRLIFVGVMILLIIVCYFAMWF